MTMPSLLTSKVTLPAHAAWEVGAVLHGAVGAQKCIGVGLPLREQVDHISRPRSDTCMLHAPRQAGAVCHNAGGAAKCQGADTPEAS